MRTIRFCIGSDDGKTIAKSHMGDMEIFCIYDISDTPGSELFNRRENTAQDHDHSGPEKMKAVLQIVHDADVLVARQKSPNFINIAKKTKYQPVVVKTENIDDILMVLQRFFDEIFDLVTQRRNGERSSHIPEF